MMKFKKTKYKVDKHGYENTSRFLKNDNIKFSGKFEKTLTKKAWRLLQKFSLRSGLVVDIALSSSGAGWSVGIPISAALSVIAIVAGLVTN